MAQLTFIKTASLAVGATLRVVTDYGVVYELTRQEESADEPVFHVTHTRDGVASTWQCQVVGEGIRVGKPLVTKSDDPVHVGRRISMRVSRLEYPAA